MFAANDRMAIRAIKAIKEARMTIPDDVAIVGFDDIAMASYVDLALTTVSQPMVKIGRVAVRQLVAFIENRNVGPTQIVLPTKLVVRQSSVRSI